ncbi:Ubiquinone/menaquinone biosynthesis C-methyltransferase UbiE [Maioricimonas rarisocia]|uniref:Ubiquinone/menaquinone biosynthesis C-methyltransferase UbiE n=1 Tax=Maioricimonas rarisocia TaxID=2528026 RepID=A0A517ZBP9_9PLAN|nr:class I SAM-dependent methyltransferase [Maioricimonas rarisocia]QDU39922.1 Ubiquinone/menaquinone biosynthesis C-methyltransferase UbiE [Maioricimonas rarisocia]
MSTLPRLLTLLLVLAAAAVSRPASAQEKSVNPGINKSFEDPDVDQFVDRFEREGRDVFDHQNEILEAIGLKPGMVVADIGAGTGLFSRKFARAVGPEGQVFAVDIAEKFVRHVESTAREAGLTNVVGVVAGADAVNLPPASVDLAFICDTYHHFEFPTKTMQSLHRALRPGGEVILIDFIRIEGVSDDWILGHVRADQETFTREITATGFRQVEDRKGLLDESYFVRFRKVPAPQAEAVPPPPPTPAPLTTAS